MTSDEASRGLDGSIIVRHRFAAPRLPHASLTLRLCILVMIAIFPAIVIQGYNEYELHKAREADIRQQVIQITKQFGEEIGELREGARQLLLALAQVPAVKRQRYEQPGYNPRQPSGAPIRRSQATYEGIERWRYPRCRSTRR